MQEALSKMDAVTVPVRWHLIGHLQRNKAKASIVSRWSTRWTAVGSRTLLHEWAKIEALRFDALMQVNVTGEEAKGGLTLSEAGPGRRTLVGVAWFACRRRYDDGAARRG